MKILHVTECFAGGVATAINMYASLVPEHEHMVLYTARRANSPAKAYPELFSQSWRLPDHHRAAIDTVRRVRDEVAPDVIHAHSSFAGAYVRLARLRGTRRRTPTVYTPHGVAFARNDISALHRAVFYSAEWALSWGTSVFAPCGQWEGDVLRRLNRRIPQVVIPNAHDADRGDMEPYRTAQRCDFRASHPSAQPRTLRCHCAPGASRAARHRISVARRWGR